MDLSRPLKRSALDEYKLHKTLKKIKRQLADLDKREARLVADRELSLSPFMPVPDISTGTDVSPDRIYESDNSDFNGMESELQGKDN